LFRPALAFLQQLANAAYHLASPTIFLDDVGDNLLNLAQVNILLAKEMLRRLCI